MANGTAKVPPLGERRANRHGWYRVHVTFTDGTRISFHEVAHVLFDATGVVKVEFDKFKAHCG